MIIIEGYFNLRKHFREIRYVLSSDIEIKAEKDIVQMQPNEKEGSDGSRDQNTSIHG